MEVQHAARPEEVGGYGTLPCASRNCRGKQFDVFSCRARGPLLAPSGFPELMWLLCPLQRNS